MRISPLFVRGLAVDREEKRREEKRRATRLMPGGE
tara:strand:- start:111 stop:215 length:105 start_codon:yes stop_codon:yes gene_type:complete